MFLCLLNWYKCWKIEETYELNFIDLNIVKCVFLFINPKNELFNTMKSMTADDLKRQIIEIFRFNYNHTHNVAFSLTTS
jgi:hypothetical protein